MEKKIVMAGLPNRIFSSEQIIIPDEFPDILKEYTKHACESIGSYSFFRFFDYHSQTRLLLRRTVVRN